jgi:hypothetical protein
MLHPHVWDLLAMVITKGQLDAAEDPTVLIGYQLRSDGAARWYTVVTGRLAQEHEEGLYEMIEHRLAHPPGAAVNTLDPITDAMQRRIVSPVAPGVEALLVDHGDVLEIPAIRAADLRIAGAVGAWLDTLPTDRTVIVPFVVSDRLAGMLERRGFTRPQVCEHPLMGVVEGHHIHIRGPQ